MQTPGIRQYFCDRMSFCFKLRSKLIFLLAKLHIYKCKNALIKPSLAHFICEIRKSEPLKNSTNLKVITIWNLF